MPGKASVDRELCIGCGLCAGRHPSLFRINSEGKAEYKGDDNSDPSEIRAAIDACPVQAIRWSD